MEICDKITVIRLEGETVHYSYEALLEKTAQGWSISFPQFPGLGVQADSRRTAADAGAQALSKEIARRIEHGEQLPEQRHIMEVSTVTVEPSDSQFDESLFMTQGDAAVSLGLSHGRVSTLVKNGQLEGRMIGRRNMVTKASVEAYSKKPRKAGRPKSSN